MSHVNIVSSDTTNIYKWLQLQSQNGVANAPVTWNFHKFLIDEAGNWVNHYPSQILPNDASIVNWILSSNITNVQDKKNEIFTFSNNANSSLFTIKSSLNGAFKIKIFSADGKLVDQQNSLDSLFTYNYNSLKNGAYFVTVQNNSNTNTFKFEVSK